MNINTNVMALNAQNMLSKIKTKDESGGQKSSLKINSTKESGAEFTISEKMRAQIKSLGESQNNAQDSISFLQTAGSALQQNTDVSEETEEIVIKAQNTGVLTEENLTAAESKIKDVDMAEEMVACTKNMILNQSAMAMLSQANQEPEKALTLLK